MRLWPIRRPSRAANVEDLVADAHLSSNGHLRVSAGRSSPSRPLLNLALFLVTCVTTLLAGTSFSGSPTFDAFRRSTEDLGWVLSGVPFAATLLGILVV